MHCFNAAHRRAPALLPAAAATSKRQRSTGEPQRSRTDWQKRDENTWTKVVPPWWAEHKTVHFASEWRARVGLRVGG